MAEPTQTFGPWLKQKLVEAGEISPDAKGVNLDPKVRDAYLKMWQNESKAAANLQPQRVQLSDGSTVDVVNGQVVRDARPKFETFVDDKGFMSRLNLDTGLVERATNAMGQPVKGKAKSANSMADLIAAMNGQPLPSEQPTPSPSPDPGMTNSMAFAGVPSRGAYETNMATPATVAAPASTDAMGMTAPAATNAPVAAAGPMTPDQVRAAYRQGAISKEQARALLQGGL